MTVNPALYYALLTAVIWSMYLYLRYRRQRQARAHLQESRASGLIQPASLHPVIDSNHCIGCRSCISACPEQNVLGLIRDKAELVNPSNCIGHGACRTACPMHAITLVFGSAERGVDIPLLTPDFETSMPGIFIAGELGGMGLIRNAVEQGRQAIQAITRCGRKGQLIDVMIIGAGPAGIAATLAASELGLRYLTIEQDSLGGTVAHFPRGKIVMTAPVNLPVIGRMNFREVSKEVLLGFWQDVVERSGITINFNERMEIIQQAENALAVRTSRATYLVSNVLLAIGRRGTPRKLGVPGEDLDKVVYRLIDPQQYQGMHVLVVGGGDSAIEAAAELAGQSGTRVTLSYRGDAFSRVKPKNRIRIAELADSGRVEILLSSNVSEIRAPDVVIALQDRSIRLPNDAVLICAGGVLPTPFLKSTGIEVETKYGSA
jgi:thioredoxin reductase/Pyruvate/2-oxoacid:ferredoxin oxidoreductase delta subunit